MTTQFVQAVPVKAALALALAFVVAGCSTVGPDFTAPAAPDVPSFRHVDAAAPDTARLPAEWWTVFGDATLNTLETRALRESPSVRAAAQRLLQAQSQLSVTRANQLPSVSVGASVANSRSSAESAQGQALGGRAIKGMDYQVGARLSYELDLWGRVRRVVEASDAQALAAQDDRDGVLLMLSSQVASTYWQLRGMDAEMVILKNALATRQESNQLVEARFNAGLSNELDVARTRIERANAEADLHAVQRQRNNLEHALATLVGATPTAPLHGAAAGDQRRRAAAATQHSGRPAGQPAGPASRPRLERGQPESGECADRRGRRRVLSIAVADR
jgi:multidrug efflux system outer membrane protein